MLFLKNSLVVFFSTQLLFSSCISATEYNINPTIMDKESHLDTIIFGAGCFWCVEAVFQQLDGVQQVTPGYCGGFVKNPSYKEVCNGTTGHAEVARIIFDSSKISLSKLVEVFFMTHDPTTLNRQGNDIGTQYRSSVFCLTHDQYNLVRSLNDKLKKSEIWPDPIVTEIEMLDQFYEAEKYHHNYYNNNKDQGYCQYVILPKLEKFKKVFSDELKSK